MLTANSTLAIRRGIVGPWISLSDQPQGVGAWTLNDTNRTRPVPSIPATLAVQRLTVRTASVSFTIDDNEISHPLMFLRSGETFSVRIRKSGDGAGLSEAVLVGPSTISLQNAEGGARTFQFNLNATEVTRIVQA